MVEWEGLDVRGVLVSEDRMLAVVEGMTSAMVEGMGEEVVGEFQKEGVAVVLTVTPGTGTYTNCYIFFGLPLSLYWMHPLILTSFHRVRKSSEKSSRLLRLSDGYF